MSEIDGNAAAVEAVARLCTARVNDVVRLAVLSPEELSERLDSLDLSLLESFERTPTGGVKVKVLDRAALLRGAALQASQPPENRVCIVDDICDAPADGWGPMTNDVAKRNSEEEA